jgi:hypothetical protein
MTQQQHVLVGHQTPVCMPVIVWCTGLLQAGAGPSEAAGKAPNGNGSSSKAASAGPPEQQAMEGDQEEVRV